MPLPFQLCLVVKGQCDVEPRSWSRVHESPQRARLGRRLHHETDQAHGGVADRIGQNPRRGLSRHRGDPADLPPLEAAVWRHAG